MSLIDLILFQYPVAFFFQPVLYEAPPRKAVEAVARDLAKLRAMGIAAGDAAKEKVLSVRPSISLSLLGSWISPFLFRIGNNMRESEYALEVVTKVRGLI